MLFLKDLGYDVIIVLPFIGLQNKKCSFILIIFQHILNISY
jgi:hypothetical protein